MADQAAEGLLSPYLRNQRIAAAKPFIAGRVLDIGCGSGGLATHVAPGCYIGIDRDPISLACAKASYPQHRFEQRLPDDTEKFDTVVSLAVIEHVADPGEFLRAAALHLEPASTSRIVITTPHPAVEWLHDLGAAVGLFSRHANEEHETLLDHARLRAFGDDARLRLVRYRRFLFGANQLAVFAAICPPR